MHKAVLQLNEAAPEKHRAVFRNAVNLLKALGPETKVELVVFGPAISVAVGEPSPELQEALSAGVRLKACRNSLAGQGLSDEAVSSAEVVPSGVAHLVIRQGEGWAYVRP